MKQKKILFVYSCFRLSRYIKGGKIHIMRHNWIFRNTCCINNAHSQMVELWYFYAILYSYFRYTGRLFLGCASFVAFCNINRASWETKKEWRLSYRKKHTEEFVWGASRLWLHALLLMSLCVAFFVYSLTPSEVTYLTNGLYK